MAIGRDVTGSTIVTRDQNVIKLKGVLTNLLSDYLGIEWLPAGIAGFILLILGPVGFCIFYLLLQNREASQNTQKGQTTR